MPWTTNPLFTPGRQDEKVNTDAEAPLQHSSEGIPDLTIPECEDWEFKTPTDSLTSRQAVYIFVLDGLVAAVLGAGINFGIAYATYHTQDAVRLFILPNALAADAGFTLLAQFIITWVVECFIVNFHLRKGLVPPIGFFREPKNRFMRWYFFLDHKQSKELRGFKPWLELILSNALRSLILLVAFFPVVFGASIGFLTLVGTRRGADWYFDVVWAPQVFKLIFGVAVGSTCTPLMAAFWLVRCGWVLKATADAGATQSVEEITSP
ncbi:hypothetical protein O1611_g2761 [Lasiodiplodia mahajangana]|uniref:Uncharacterized protein n=1 Tax=Lasiodiplodia mahajangana TaxID=1108764 RepID=A0ACC2JUK8_9PEZI|nr:hypothetical protein O1611_g2761 [Lasiodiplodia mahajangana]